MTIVDNPFAHGDMRARHDAARRGQGAEGALRLSLTVSQLVERIRSRYGISFEVVDAALQPVLPETGGHLIQAIGASPAVRAAVTSAMQGSRSRTIEATGGAFLIQPLRGGRGSRPPMGLLAVRQTDPASQLGGGDQGEQWLDVLRTAVESEVSSSEVLHEERVQARRVVGALRFVSQLAGMASEAELAHAVVHAAAVWFDVDARVYRSDVAGDFQLHTHLPGISDAARYPSLGSGVVGGGGDARRLSQSGEGDGLGWAVPDAVVVPIVAETARQWVLVLGGVVSADAQLIFQTVGDALGAQFARLGTLRRQALRRRFQATAAQASRAPERTVIELLRQVMAESGAASGAVTLFDAGGSRRLAAVGAPLSPAGAPGERQLSVGRITQPLSLGDDDHALLELAPPPGAAFTPDAIAASVEAVAALQVVLLEVLRKDDLHRGAAAGVTADGDPVFVERISQEVERAKRFDLGLSMLLIDVEAQSLEARTLRDLMSTVRAELRGSDVLGVVGRGRFAALLVHTNVSGVGAVVARIRQRLQRHSQELPALRLGRAVLSSECATPSDFLSQASRNVETVAAA